MSDPGSAMRGSAPVVMTGRGGSGTRLFSIALQELGVFLGNRINKTADSMEWVDPVYRLALDKLKTGVVPAGAGAILRANAEAILAAAGPGHGAWGWKLPETVLVLPEIAAAFEHCRIIHVVRHPLDTCLRRTHRTSRADDMIGDSVLTAAYRELGWSHRPATDPEHVRNAVSWRYQVGLATAFLARFPAGRGLTVRYEALCDAPEATIARLAQFVGVPLRPVELQVDDARRRLWAAGDSRIDEVWALCGELAQVHGYGRDGSTEPA